MAMQVGPNVSSALDAYRAAEGAHRALYERVIGIKAAATGMTQGERVDCAFLLAEATKLADDMRKEASLAKELLMRLACVVWAQETVNDVGASPSVRGKIAVGTPDVKTMYAIPSAKTDPVEYKKFCNHLGLIGRGLKTGAFKPDYPALVEIISERIAKGQKLPPGMGGSGQYVVYRLSPLRRLPAAAELLGPPQETTSENE